MKVTLKLKLSLIATFCFLQLPCFASAGTKPSEIVSDCRDLDLSRLLVSCSKIKCSADYMYQKNGKMYVEVKGRDQVGACDIKVSFKYQVLGAEKDRKHVCIMNDPKIRDRLAKELSMIASQIGGSKRGFGVLSKECK